MAIASDAFVGLELWSDMLTASYSSTVTHEWTPVISPSVYECHDCRLLFITNRSCIFIPRPHRSPNAVLAARLLLLGGVEPNPGPATISGSAKLGCLPALTLGCFNVRSVLSKIVLIHDIIVDHNIDILALQETWLPLDTHPFHQV
jgi:hypothetical protein